MRAARYYGREDVRVDEVPEPSPGRHEVKLRVSFAGVCGSDLHEYYAGPIFTFADAPHPLTGVRNPAILGHELCGEVVDVGPDVVGIEPGALVAVEPVEYCERCEHCLTGERHLCQLKAIHGYTRTGGGFAEFTTVKQSMVHVLPDGMTAEQGALIEPLSVGLAAARRAQIRSGETAAIHGAGPIGLATAFALRAAGADTIIVDPSPVRRRVAERLGLGQTVDPTTANPVEAIKELTRGVGANASIDAAGVPAALHAAIESTAYDRYVVMVAVPLAPIALPVALFRRGLVHLTASSGNQDFPATIDGMAGGNYQLDGWITKIALEEIVPSGFEALHRQERIKVLVDLSR
jgi:(R,R)-butanediol dehydrogenase/meso-butanediol dehydrogenase/diacetyl reductase